jgi:hypothetical protein
LGLHIACADQHSAKSRRSNKACKFEGAVAASHLQHTESEQSARYLLQQTQENNGDTELPAKEIDRISLRNAVNDLRD